MTFPGPYFLCLGKSFDPAGIIPIRVGSVQLGLKLINCELRPVTDLLTASMRLESASNRSEYFTKSVRRPWI